MRPFNEISKVILELITTTQRANFHKYFHTIIKIGVVISILLETPEKEKITLENASNTYYKIAITNVQKFSIKEAL